MSILNTEVCIVSTLGTYLLGIDKGSGTEITNLVRNRLHCVVETIICQLVISPHMKVAMVAIWPSMIATHCFIDN